MTETAGTSIHCATTRGIPHQNEILPLSEIMSAHATVFNKGLDPVETSLKVRMMLESRDTVFHKSCQIRMEI